MVWGLQHSPLTLPTLQKLSYNRKLPVASSNLYFVLLLYLPHHTATFFEVIIPSSHLGITLVLLKAL